MNTKMSNAQWNYDNLQPLPDSESAQAARDEWLYNAAEDLILGCDVKINRGRHFLRGVTYKQFILAVDEHVNKRLADMEIATPALALLLLSSFDGPVDKVAAAELLGNSKHVLGMLGEIAQRLLEPLVDVALNPLNGNVMSSPI